MIIHLDQGHVPDMLKRLHGGFYVELLFGGLRNEGLSYVPGNGDIHILVAIPVDHMHHHQAALFGDANVVVGILHCHEFAFRSTLEGIEDGPDVYVIGAEVTDVNFAVAQLSVVDRRDNLFRQG